MIVDDVAVGKRRKSGVLLVNLGTPDSPNPTDVKRYLKEFLTDGRVIDIPWLKRQLLTRAIIVPKRYRESAENYRQIWQKEGSPLMIYGLSVERKLQQLLGEEYQVELAMRYQQPSIAEKLQQLSRCKEIVILPLFPQYASATTGSVHQRVMEHVSSWARIPAMRFVESYPLHPKMIEAFSSRARSYPIDEYDKLLFSFHGLPERQLKKCDGEGYCLEKKECCHTLREENASCYGAQCYATAAAIAKNLGLDKGRYSVSFQSRLGGDPWIRPYTSDLLKTFAESGIKKVLVLCPAFVCDCVETIHEIGIEYKNEFIACGGEQLHLVEGLNDHPLWIETLADLVHNY